MKGFGLGEDGGLKEIASDQVADGILETLLLHLGFQKDCCGCRWDFSGISKKTFQENLLIQVHTVARGNHR